MAILPIEAHIRAESASGWPSQQPKPKPSNSFEIDRVLDAAEADIRSLRCWRSADPNTPMITEVGQRLIEVGRWLKGQRVAK